MMAPPSPSASILGPTPAVEDRNRPAEEEEEAAASSLPPAPKDEAGRLAHHPPPIAWTRRFDDVPDPSSFRPAMPGFLESLSLIPLAMRMGAYVTKERKEGRDPIFDLNGLMLQPPNPGPYAGVPLGGIGGGCIGRGFRGEFRRWNLAPGKYHHGTVAADQFSVRVKRAGKVFTQVLSVDDGRDSEALRGWAWGMRSGAATYHALFPRAWTVYEEAAPLIKLTCRQVSPVMPHDYIDSSLPTAVFEWTVENLGPAPAEVSLLFTFQNGTGAAQDKAGGHYNRPFVVLQEGEKEREAPSVVGVQMHHAQAAGARASHRAARSPPGGAGTDGKRTGAGSSSSSSSFSSSTKVNSMQMQRDGGPTPEERMGRASPGSALDAAVSSLAASLCDCGESCRAAALEVDGVCRNCGLDIEKEAAPMAAEQVVGGVGQKPPTGHGRKAGRDESGPPEPLPLTFAIACPVTEGVKASVWHQFRTSLPPNGDDGEPGARELWAQFSEEGSLDRAAGTGVGADKEEDWWTSETAHAAARGPDGARVVERWAGLPLRPSRAKEAVAGAVCQKATVPGHGRRTLTFTLAWDMPYAVFGKGLALPRRYTRFFPGSLRGTASSSSSSSSSAAPSASVAGLLAAHALRQYRAWEAAIEAWQRPVLEDAALPAFYRHMLFNELYYLTDGGTVWTDSAGGESLEGAGARGGVVRDKDNAAFRECHGEQALVGQFLYLEGHEYLMYNTYDVHFYASFALAMLWPMLELSLQQDVAAAVMAEDPRLRRLIARGELRPRKVQGSVPHDLGCPSGEPWREANAYNLQDVNRWKDLGPKLVLQVQRDFAATRSRPFLDRLWPVLVRVMQGAQAYDRDGDGLIENENFPDQTYDIWAVEGPSAYTGGLWVAALTAMAAMGETVGDAPHAARYRAQAARARAAYVQRLWNGRYFDYDASDSVHQDSIMADQMAGQWYARACGLPPVVDPAQARSSLGTVFEFNVQKFADGRSGAVNGMRPDGSVDGTCMQSQEVWTGTTYSVAAAMLQEARWAEEEARRQEDGRALGLREEAAFLRHAAFETARGLYEAGWKRLGYWFATPEAWNERGHYRSLGYMRPLCIWSMQWALTCMDMSSASAGAASESRGAPAAPSASSSSSREEE